MEKILLQLYVLGLGIYGVLTANEEIIANFKGAKMLILLAVLILFYNLIILITNKLMIFVGSILIKMADKKRYDKELANKHIIRYMLVIYFAHLVSLYVGNFGNVGVWSNIVYLVAVIYIIANVFNNEQYKKITSKVMVVIPFLIYTVLDAFFM